MTTGRNPSVSVSGTIDAISDPVFVLNTITDEVVDCNECGSWFLGYRRNELKGEPVSRIHPDDMDRLRRVATTAQRSKSIQETDLSCRRKTGQTVGVAASILPVSHESVAPSLRQRAGVDATDLGEQVFAVVDRADCTSRHATQLAGLLRILRHTIRNRSNVILGQLDLAAVDEAPTESDQISDAVRACEDIVQTTSNIWEIRDVLERGPRSCTETDVVPPVERAVERVRTEQASDRITLQTPETAGARVLPDISLAVRHTVENAVVHNDDPRVRVVVRGSETLEEACVEIEVADDGSGIPAAERRVADLESPPTPVAHGSGLGLWISAWIVRQSRGSVDIETGSDGTIVSLRVPSAEL